MAIEIVDLPIKHGDFPKLCKRLPEGNPLNWMLPDLAKWLGGVYPNRPLFSGDKSHLLSKAHAINLHWGCFEYHYGDFRDEL
jgi:hypothetical protein